MTYVYLNASRDVVAVGMKDRTIAEVQANIVGETLTERVFAPDIDKHDLKRKTFGPSLDEERYRVKRDGKVKIGFGRPDHVFFHRRIDGEAGTDISHYEEVADLQLLKDWRYAQIDLVDEIIIEWGYEFPPSSGQVLSMSHNAQRKLLALATVNGWAEWQAAAGYPITLSLKDDQAGQMQLANEAELRACALTALGTADVIIGVGDGIKTAVRAATSEAEIDAIVDSRLDTWPKPGA